MHHRSDFGCDLSLRGSCLFYKRPTLPPKNFGIFSPRFKMPVKFEPVSGKSLLYFKQYPKPKRVGFDKTSDTLGNLNEEPWGGTVRSML